MAFPTAVLNKLHIENGQLYKCVKTNPVTWIRVDRATNDIEVSSIEQVSIPDRYVIKTADNEYMYLSNTMAGDIAPSNQQGSTGFWVATDHVYYAHNGDNTHELQSFINTHSSVNIVGNCRVDGTIIVSDNTQLIGRIWGNGSIEGYVVGDYNLDIKTNIIKPRSGNGINANIYVDPIFGKDTNDGSELEPLKSIQKAIQIAVDGDVIGLMSGRHEIENTIGYYDKKISIRSVNDEQAIITPKLIYYSKSNPSPEKRYIFIKDDKLQTPFKRVYAKDGVSIIDPDADGDLIFKLIMVDKIDIPNDAIVSINHRWSNSIHKIKSYNRDTGELFLYGHSDIKDSVAYSNGYATFLDHGNQEIYVPIDIFGLMENNDNYYFPLNNGCIKIKEVTTNNVAFKWFISFDRNNLWGRENNLPGLIEAEKVVVNECSFEDNMNGIKASHIEIYNSTCYGHGRNFATNYKINNVSPSTFIAKNNRIYDCGKLDKFSIALYAIAQNIDISNNKIVNGGWSAIRCDRSWAVGDNFDVNGLVYNNVCKYKRKYDYPYFVGFDGGIITSNGRNGGGFELTIRNNVFIEYPSPGRWGVFFDDGARGITFIQNIIISDAQAGIHARYVSTSPNGSKDNKIIDNIIKGVVYMDSRPGYFYDNIIDGLYDCGVNTTVFNNKQVNISYADDKIYIHNRGIYVEKYGSVAQEHLVFNNTAYNDKIGFGSTKYSNILGRYSLTYGRLINKVRTSGSPLKIDNSVDTIYSIVIKESPATVSALFPFRNDNEEDYRDITNGKWKYDASTSTYIDLIGETDKPGGFDFKGFVFSGRPYWRSSSFSLNWQDTIDIVFDMDIIGDPTHNEILWWFGTWLEYGIRLDLTPRRELEIVLMTGTEAKVYRFGKARKGPHIYRLRVEKSGSYYNIYFNNIYKEGLNYIKPTQGALHWSDNTRTRTTSYINSICLYDIDRNPLHQFIAENIDPSSGWLYEPISEQSISPNSWQFRNDIRDITGNRWLLYTDGYNYNDTNNHVMVYDPVTDYVPSGYTKYPGFVKADISNDIIPYGCPGGGYPIQNHFVRGSNVLNKASIRGDEYITVKYADVNSIPNNAIFTSKQMLSNTYSSTDPDRPDIVWVNGIKYTWDNDATVGISPIDNPATGRWVKELFISINANTTILQTDHLDKVVMLKTSNAITLTFDYDSNTYDTGSSLTIDNSENTNAVTIAITDSSGTKSILNANGHTKVAPHGKAEIEIKDSGVFLTGDTTA